MDIDLLRGWVKFKGTCRVTRKEFAASIGISVPTLRKILREERVSNRILSKVESFGRE
jgi:hypothetical protein